MAFMQNLFDAYFKDTASIDKIVHYGAETYWLLKLISFYDFQECFCCMQTFESVLRVLYRLY